MMYSSHHPTVKSPLLHTGASCPLALLGGLVVLCLLGGCQQKMIETPRYEPYEAGPFFRDSLAMRPLVEGTVPRGDARLTTPYYAGTNPYYDEEGTFVGRGDTVDYERRLTNAFPIAITEPTLERGRQQFDIYCAPCHGRTGDGQGMIVQRGLRAPPSYHTERLRQAPAGHFFNVITNGYGAMYSYAARIAPADRWAIVAYIRALQLSQHATLEDVPADRRTEMQILMP